MTIAGVAVGATRGYIYLRWEYPDAHAALKAAIATAYQQHYLGENILGSGKRFELEVRLGAGAYICGEETSLLESLESKRGQVRFKPPLPAIQGLFGKPTVINNVITLASVPIILDQGAEHYQHFGMGRSRGTLPIQLAGNIKPRRPDREGLWHHPARVAVRLRRRQSQRAADPRGAGRRPAGGVPARVAVRCEARLRSLHRDQGDAGARRYRGLRRHGRHGSAGALCDGVLRHRILRQVHPVPHRLDPRHGGDRPPVAGNDPARQEQLLRDLCDTMTFGSLCALGGLTPYPVLSAINHFPEDFVTSARARVPA